MKYFFLLCIALAICIQTIQAQQNNYGATYSNNQYRDYRKKRNTNNTIGQVCLTTGLVVGFIGAIEIAGEGVMKHSDAYKANATATFAAGNIIALASIPFFVIAHNDKKKASLSLQRGAFIIDQKSIPNTGYAQLSLTLRM